MCLSIHKLLAHIIFPGAAEGILPNEFYLQPAAGLHCALVAQIVEQLLCAICASINVHVLKAGLIPRLTYMAFEFPKNNIIQAATSRAVRSGPQMSCSSCAALAIALQTCSCLQSEGLH